MSDYTVHLDLVRVATNRMPRGVGIPIYNADGSPYGRALQHNKRDSDIEEESWESLVLHLQQRCNQTEEGDTEIVLAAHETSRERHPNFKIQVLYRGSHGEGLQKYNQLLAELNVPL